MRFIEIGLAILTTALHSFCMTKKEAKIQTTLPAGEFAILMQAAKRFGHKTVGGAARFVLQGYIASVSVKDKKGELVLRDS